MHQNTFAALRPPGTAGEPYSAVPDHLARFGAGNREGGMERAREEMGTEVEEKEGEEKREGDVEWKLGWGVVSLALGG